MEGSEGPKELIDYYSDPLELGQVFKSPADTVSANFVNGQGFTVMGQSCSHTVWS